MMQNGPKKLYRISWSRGKFPNAEGSSYYSDEKFLLKKLQKLTDDEADIRLEFCEPQWKVQKIAELLTDS